MNQFCEDRDLMGNVRGDGSARSQQTRLGKALGVKRDRVFNGLTVKRVSETNHRTGILYALTPADGDQPGPLRSRNLSLLDSLGGDLDAGGDVVETLADQRLHHIEPLESADYGDGGDVGDVVVTPNARERKKREGSIEIGAEERECADFIQKSSGDGENVSHVSTASATDTKGSNLMVETLGQERLHQVSTKSPPRPSTAGGGGIDLARLPEGTGKAPP
ncbi:MAG: hypothetical protein LC114_12655 [Bryobacterales bacterium]|nr:hypothetical protein [Bryobacterales bacterium]